MIAPILATSILGCTPGFQDVIDHGVPNLVEIAPRLYRMGEPAGDYAWQYLASRVGEPGGRVLVVKLNDEKEGSDQTAAGFVGWRVLLYPLPPEDDKPWSVFDKPSVKEVRAVVDVIAQAYANGDTVIWHCTHGRDRTGLVTALVGMRLLGWSKSQAWSDMIRRGFRWELPDLDAFWIENVPAEPSGR